MSAELLAKSFASTREVLAAVTPEQVTGSATPCASWDVKELINHIVNGTAFFADVAENGKPSDSGDAPDPASGDYVAAFDAGTARAVRAFEADGIMEQILHLPFGDMPGSAFCNIASADSFTHGWDLAKATGQSTDLAPAVATELLAFATGMLSDATRGENGVAPFGPECDAPAGASEADKLAAFLGRTI